MRDGFRIHVGPRQRSERPGRAVALLDSHGARESLDLGRAWADSRAHRALDTST